MADNTSAAPAPPRAEDVMAWLEREAAACGEEGARAEATAVTQLK